jgi:hypothetical protein
MSQTWDADKGPSDEQVSDALTVLRAEYWSSIRAMAKDLVGRVDAGEITDDSEMSDAIHEDADGCYWTIYTAGNYRAMLCSDQEPFALAEEEGLEKPESPAVCAYLVVHHDVTEQVNAELGGSVEDYLQEKQDAEAERFFSPRKEG